MTKYPESKIKIRLNNSELSIKIPPLRDNSSIRQKLRHSKNRNQWSDIKKWIHFFKWLAIIVFHLL